MAEAPVYPVVIAERHSQEIWGYDSFERLQRDVEVIDVENDQYEAWDSLGRPLLLRPRPDMVHYVGATQAVIDLFWWLQSFLRPRGREPVQAEDDGGWLDIVVVSPEPDPNLLPRLRAYVAASRAASGRITNDDGALAPLIAQLPPMG